jgi:type I restriction enzyme S subunit
MSSNNTAPMSGTIEGGSGMSGEWPLVNLGQVVNVRSGYAFKSGDWTETGVPVVKIANVKSGRLEMSSCSYVSPSVAASCGEFQLIEDDIVIAMTGYIGDVAKIRPVDLPCVLNQRVGKFTIIDSQRLDKGYLFAFLSWQETRTAIESLGYGSAQPNVSPSLIHSVSIPLPPLPEQRRIAKILGDLDDKIELNRKMNETLEQMARTLFKSWFIDFDPVRAKMEGRQPPGMDADTAALFPSRLVESELGMVPEGWEVAEIDSIAETIDCLHSKKPEQVEHGFPMLQLNNIRNDGLVDLTDCYLISGQDYSKWTSRMEATSGDCVITNVGRVGAVAKIPDDMKAALGRNMTGIRCRASFQYPTFLIECLLSSAMREEIARKVDTGTILDALNVKSIPRLRFIRSANDIVDRFEMNVLPIRKTMEKNLSQSRTLASLRDTLLPKLMRGEVRQCK